MSKILASIDHQAVERRINGLRRPVFTFIIIIVAALPWLTRDNRYFILVLSLMGIYTIAVTGLNIVYGYSGQISFGHAAFYGIGAYGVAILSALHGWPVWASVLIGIVVAGLVAAIVGWLSVKLVHHFLALVTIGVGEIVRLTLLNADTITQGFRGISSIPRPILLGVSFADPVMFTYLILALAGLSLWVSNNLTSSWWGRAFHAVRTNPKAAESFGTPLVKTRTLAFVIGSVYAALAGGLYASLITYISPDSFTFTQSTLFFTMVLIGGSGTLWGPVLGVIILTYINQYGQQFQIYQGIFYGFMIVVIVIFLPRGVIGSLEDLYRDLIKAPARRGGRGVTIVEEEVTNHG